MTHLSTLALFKENARGLGKHIDDCRILPAIDESEQLYIKPRIGDSLYIDLLAYTQANQTTKKTDTDDSPYHLLLYGGIYTQSDGQAKQIKGLIQSLHYYTLARLLKTNNYILTHHGTAHKIDNSLTQKDIVERLALQNDCLYIAHNYLLDCLAYLRTHNSLFPNYHKPKRNHHPPINIIGK